MSNGAYTLRMRQLPKPEYALCKALQATYGIEDISELFAIALRLMAEVETYRGISGAEGTAWILNVIHSYRSTPEAQRA